MSNNSPTIYASGDARMYVSDDRILVSNLISDMEYARREGLKEVKKKGYSTIEGCIRQSMDLPIGNSGQH